LIGVPVAAAAEGTHSRPVRASAAAVPFAQTAVVEAVAAAAADSIVAAVAAAEASWAPADTAAVAAVEADHSALVAVAHMHRTSAAAVNARGVGKKEFILGVENWIILDKHGHIATDRLDWVFCKETATGYWQC
jgi:hypothetical protein